MTIADVNSNIYEVLFYFTRSIREFSVTVYTNSKM